MLLYLDWNVFNILEKRNSLEQHNNALYKKLYSFLRQGTVKCPYSNAHINDLIRGYKKDPTFIEGHLGILKELTKEFCICQYWKQSAPLWHYRSVSEFFYSAIEEKEDEWETFEDLLNHEVDLGHVKLQPLRMQASILKLKPVPASFKQVYQTDPIFGIMFPQTRVEMNEYALSSDLYNFFNAS